MLMSGILPLSFVSRPDYNDRELVKILLKSLESHWTGKAPFFLRVIVPDPEFETISEKSELQRWGCAVHPLGKRLRRR